MIGDGESQPEHCGVQWLFLLQAESLHEAKADAGTVVSDVPAERETATITMIQMILFILVFYSSMCCGSSLHAEPQPQRLRGLGEREPLSSGRSSLSSPAPAPLPISLTGDPWK